MVFNHLHAVICGFFVWNIVTLKESFPFINVFWIFSLARHMRVCWCFAVIDLFFFLCLTLNSNVTLWRFPMTEYVWCMDFVVFAFFLSYKFCIFSRFLFTVLIFGWKQKFFEIETSPFMSRTKFIHVERVQWSVQITRN